MRSTNRYRAHRCDRALRRYDTDVETKGCLVDFLADARHWCDRNRQSYAELDQLAQQHYSAEVIAAGKDHP